MDEIRFRSLVHDAIGDEPTPRWLDAQVRARLLTPGERVVRWRLVLAIAALAILLVAGLVGEQYLARRSVLVPAPAATPSPTPVPSPVAVDPSNCRLPVLVERGSGPPTQLANEVGFVDTRTGQYTRDDSVNEAGLPGSGSGAPRFYSAAMHRWLPVGAREVAPGGLS